jgi:hypothetical protein
MLPRKAPHAWMGNGTGHFRLISYPGVCCFELPLGVKGSINVGWTIVRWKPIPIRWPFYKHGGFMDIYTLGKLALPVVIVIMAVSAILTLAMGLFTTLKTLESVQRFFQHMEESRRSSLTINVMTGKRSSQPPMREHD